LASDGLEALSFPEVAPDGNTVFFVAARHQVEPASRAPIPHTKTDAWEVTRFAVALFRDLTKRRANRPQVRWYKDLDVPQLHNKIQGFEAIGQTIHERSAGLVSSLIVSHPFPNANHRTSLDLARYYIASHGIIWPYELRGRGRGRLHRETGRRNRSLSKASTCSRSSATNLSFGRRCVTGTRRWKSDQTPNGTSRSRTWNCGTTNCSNATALCASRPLLGSAMPMSKTPCGQRHRTALPGGLPG
jgi:prophage maintenance system killer protein